MRSALTSHWPLAVLAAIALPLIFARLGAECLWEDEGDTAVLASSIVKSGIPKAWDGVTFTDSDRGERVNGAMVMVSHPWAQYYLAAASFAVFGENAFTARLPFAIAGWLTILVLYGFVWRISASRFAAFASAALLVLNVQFLLYCRQSRYYTLTLLLVSSAAWIFFEMKSVRTAALFAAAGVLLFHCQPFAVVPIIALGILSLGYRPFRPQRRWFWLSVPIVLLLTAPWFALATRGYGQGAQLVQGATPFAARFAQALIEITSVTPLIGVVILAALCVWRRNLSTNARGLVIILLTTAVLYAAALAVAQSTNVMWYHGLRYAAPVLPLATAAAGMVIAEISRRRIATASALLVVFGFTKFAQITPWFAWLKDGRLPFGSYVVAVHMPSRTATRFIGNGLSAYLNDLTAGNPGTIAQACAFFETYAAPGDVLISNYGWEPLYFHTHLPQAWKILTHYRIREAALRSGLPDYVFGVDHARWVFWRPYWDGYLDYLWSDAERQITEAGGRLEPVAEFEETLWENRENVHFHRFAGGVYLFEPPAVPIDGVAPQSILPARIFRVDW
ncbi:MAG: glycosyltransferase family 39 protein [Chthoniobacterales bacterium]